jgi:hypothetical protein
MTTAFGDDAEAREESLRSTSRRRTVTVMGVSPFCTER